MGIDGKELNITSSLDRELQFLSNAKRTMKVCTDGMCW
jgi:hypothetical protein